MTENEQLLKINKWLKNYSDYIDSKRIKDIIDYENGDCELVFYDRRISGYTIMDIEELPYNKNISEAINLKFGKPCIPTDRFVFYSYCVAIPYSFDYLLKNPKGRELNSFAKYGIYGFKNHMGCMKIPCSTFDDFNSLFAPAIEDFQFNSKRKEEFINLIEELNNIKNETPKIYMVLNHQTTPMNGFFIMLLEYIDKLYLLQIINE